MNIGEFQPTQDRLLVRLDDRSAESAGGIIIPERARGGELWGEVVKAGPECEHVAVGERVHVPASCGTKVAVGGVEYVMLREGQVPCK